MLRPDDELGMSGYLVGLELVDHPLKRFFSFFASKNGFSFFRRKKNHLLIQLARLGLGMRQISQKVKEKMKSLKLENFFSSFLAYD